MNFQNCINCGQNRFSVTIGQIYCCEYATVQPRFLVRDYLPAQKANKKNYEKKGIQSYLKTEYYNIIKEFKVEGSKELIERIIDQNEKFVKICKSIFQAIAVKKKQLKESFFKRNYFINQNVVLFFVLVKLKRFDVLDKILDRFKYSESLKLKKIYLEMGQKTNLGKIKNKGIQFIRCLLNHQELDEESCESESLSYLLKSI